MARSEHEGGAGGERHEPYVSRRSGREIYLGTNRTLNQLADRLKGTRPDWGRIYDDLLINPRSSENPATLRGEMGEKYAKHVIDDAVSSGELDGEVVIDPIQPGTQTEQYEFKLDKDSRFYSRVTDTKNRVGEYDFLADVVDLRTVGEIKTNESRQKIARARRKGLQPAMTERKITDIFEPIAEVDNRNTFGYFVAALEGVPDRAAPTEQTFVEKGGILLELPATYDEFDEKSRDLAERLIEQRRSTPPDSGRY